MLIVKVRIALCIMTEINVIYSGMFWFDLNKLVSPKRTAGKVCLHQIRANSDSEYQMNPISILANEAVTPCSKMSIGVMMSNKEQSSDELVNTDTHVVLWVFAHAQLNYFAII